MKADHSSLLDRAAIALSGLCIVHCLAGALLVASMTIAGGWLSHDVHAVGLAIAMPLAVVALWRGMRLHGRFAIALLGGLGLALMVGSLLAGHGGSSEVLLSIAGVSVLAGAHVWNLRAIRG